MARNSHLSLEERNIISNMLFSGNSLTQIAKALNRDLSTIRLEIVKHRQSSRYVSQGKIYNNCALRMNKCKGYCDKCSKFYNGQNCFRCSSCNDLCSKYQPDSCKRITSKPYCCNGCKDMRHCTLLKYFYKPDIAQKEYRETLISSREGLNISEAEISQMASVIRSQVKEKKQSIHAAVMNNPDLFTVSERTLYNYVDQGVFDTKNIDLPKKVRFMPRRSKPHHKVDRKCTEGRTYSDFQNYVSEHPELDVVEFDSVEGPKGTPCLLTMFFRSCSFQLSFLRKSNDSASVISIINHLYDLLGHDDFVSLFPVILTDNGTEFSNPTAIEKVRIFDNDTGELISEVQRTKVFYCNPSSPYEKGACERNHEFIRYFVPKGKSFSSLSQDDISLMMNHINSYVRGEKKNLKSPTSRFIFCYGDTVASKLGIVPIDPNDVTLTPHIFVK